MQFKYSTVLKISTIAEEPSGAIKKEIINWMDNNIGKFQTDWEWGCTDGENLIVECNNKEKLLMFKLLF